MSHGLVSGSLPRAAHASEEGLGPWSVSRTAPWFLVAMVFVGVVSLYDGYLVVQTGESIREFEKNPVGVYLIDLNGGDPTLFLKMKAAGTIVVLTALTVLHRHSRRLASPVALALLLFQSGLLVFLESPL